MSESNSDLARRWFEEVWNQGKEETIDELLAPDAVAFGLDGTGEPRHAPEHFRRFWREMRAALSDIHIEIHQIITEGDTTALRFSFTARHTGPYLGAPATGRNIHFTCMTFINWKDGKAVAGWNEYDALGFLVQTGVKKIY